MKLTLAFLKIFFRNPRGWFFAIFLPAGIFVIAAWLGEAAVLHTQNNLRYQDYLLLGVLAMAVMQMGVYNVAYLMIDYRKGQILKRLSVTPLSPARFLTAFILSRLVVALLQAALLVIIGYAWFGARLQNLYFLPLLILPGVMLFTNLGFIIASIARDYEEAAPYTTIAGLSLVFLGDVFFPTQNLPHALVKLADFLPLKAFTQILRHYLLDFPLAEPLEYWLVIATWLLLLGVAAPKIFRKTVYR